MLRPAFGPPQGEPEGATRAEFRLHADGAAVQLDQAFREREAEARPFVAAALARVELHELLKQLSLIRRGDADAGVAHGDAHGAGVLEPRAERDAPAIGRELDGVGEEVEKHLAEAPAVGRDYEVVGRRLDDELVPPGFKLSADGVGGLL